QLRAPGVPDREERAAVNMATPGYFALMGIPLLHGRSFAAGDVAARPPAIVLSASLARALFGTTDAVGRLVRPPTPGDADDFFRVVGVVGDVPRWRIEDGPVRMAYFPQLRDGDGIPNDSVSIPLRMRGASYVVHSEAGIAQLAPALRAAVRELDGRLPVTRITTLPAMADAATARVRLTMLLLAAAAGAALLLGCIGIYSLVSYGVAGRLREFGVRLALGASPASIRSLVLRDSVGVIAIGVIAGILAALWGAQFARSLLYRVSPSDPTLYAATTLLFLALAGVATLVPARRAAMLDPAGIMRGE
ncbi:MAG: ABC transporter permease, partial [Longimicrobiales bacterium]